MMSIKIKERLLRLLIETTHEERQEIDREVEKRTGEYCDKGIERVSDREPVPSPDEPVPRSLLSRFLEIRKYSSIAIRTIRSLGDWSNGRTLAAYVP